MHLLLLFVELCVNWAMVGVIWMVQIVHYPLFAKVGRETFPSYQESHMRRISFVVIPLMLTELACSLWSLVLALMRGRLFWAPLVGSALLLWIWLSTFVRAVPLHQQLAVEFSEALHHKLVAVNWTRTVLWTIKAVLLAWYLGAHFFFQASFSI
ncbi:MAG: hypothetical protein AAGJ35_09670 [Myxococcota bacterium]